jgi:hypothetical protein
LLERKDSMTMLMVLMAELSHLNLREPADVSETPLPTIAFSRSRRLRLIFFVVVVLAIAAGITAWVVTMPSPNLSLQSFGRIKLGMSVSEVNGVFGMRGEMGECGEGECSWFWRQKGNNAFVSFGQEDGKATCGYFITPDGKQHWLTRKE